MRLSKSTLIVWLVTLSLILSACQSRTPAPTPSTLPTGALTPTKAAPTEVKPALTPTKAKSDSLVVCVPDEPATLYPYGGSSRSMWDVLEAVYDGPFDTRDYAIQPVICKKYPPLQIRMLFLNR